MNKQRAWLAALFLLMASAPLWAEPAALIYRQLRGTAPAAAAAQSAVSAVQSDSWASPIDPKLTYGNPNLAVFGSFSDTDNAGSGHTAGVTVGLYHKSPSGTYTFLGIAGVGTLTGSFVELNGTRAPGVAPLSFDTRGAPVYDVRLRAVPSSGDVTLVHYPYGGGGREGE